MQEVFEKIIEKLKETSIFMTTCDGYGANCVSVGTIEKIVKQEAAEYNNGWIPADEPPKDDNFVLLSFENFSLPMVGRYEADGKGGGTYYLGDCDGEDSCIANDLYVNAWQPLPESYRPCTNEEPKIQTNADRTRSMTDDELSTVRSGGIEHGNSV